MAQNEFMNRKAGGFALGMIILASYASIKYFLVGASLAFMVYTIWFGIIILQALAADLFGANETWIYKSLKKIEQSDQNPQEKMNMIKYHLEIAVNKWLSIFLMVNGFEDSIKQAGMRVKKIVKGKISIKELIIIVAYIIYDLVFRAGELSLTHPWDYIITFGILITIKVVNANKGIANVVAEMWKEATRETVGNRQKLSAMEDYIQQLGALYNLEQQEAETKTKAKTKPKS